MTGPIVEKSTIKTWFLIPLIVFIGLIVMLFFRLGKPTDIVVDNALNRPVPMFELPLLSDMSKKVSNNQLPSHPYLINVWGSWCPTCIVEHPFLLELDKQGVDIVGVNYQDEVENALAYLRRMSDPFVFSVHDYTGSLAIDLGLTGAPETFVVDSQDNIRQHIVGEINEKNWNERVKPCMTLLEELSNDDIDLNKSETTARIAEVCK